MIIKDPKKILLADDSVFFRNKLSSILTEAGHEVSFAGDGREVLSKLIEDENSGTPDLLILDLQMPHIDGFGVLEELQKKGLIGKFPILAVTGVYEPGDVLKRVKALGADGLLTKGFSPEQVLHRIHQLVFPDDDMREEERAPISIPADFTVGDVSHSGFLLNINGMGLFLHTNTTLMAGGYVSMKFSLPGSEKIFNVKGTVKWTTEPSEKSTLFCGAGIIFTNISDEDKKELREFSRKQLNMLGLE